MEGNRPCRHLGLLILGLILICTLQDSVAIDAPAIVSVENEGSTISLKVTWTPSTGATAHVVTWSQPDGSGNGTSPDLSGTAADYTIPGLTPGTLYNVTVTAQNGTDDTSDDSAQGRTKPSPVNLSEFGASNDSISAQWIKPSGAIDEYTFSCSNGTEDPSSPIAEDDSNMYQASCEGLSTAGANYTITVTSQSGDESSNDTTITITALPNPVELTGGNSTVNSVSATWMKPAGEVTSYEVQCSDGNVLVSPSDQTGVGPFSASCTDLLIAGDEYTMNVTSLSNGQRSDVTTIALRALPEAVELSEASDEVTTSSIAATWTAPSGTVEYYNVSCPVGDPSPARVKPSDNLMASCVNLTMPGDNYSISVTTVSYGERSETDTITITALPEAVTLNEESNMVNTTTITASWSNATGEFDHYEVSCSEGNATPAKVNPSDTLTASCENLPMPGDDYDISVTTVSNGQSSAASTITITACM